MKKLRIAVLFHRNTLRWRLHKYCIDYYASVWKSDGHEVIYLFGTDKSAPADVCFVHIDLSIVPPEYLEFARRYPVTVNGNVADTRRTSFSTNLVKPEEAYSGEVMVKSNNNYYGWPEAVLSRNPIAMVRARPPWPLNLYASNRSPAQGYRVYESIEQVPRRLIDDPSLVVEKFRPDREGGRYHVNLYVFLGECHQFLRESSSHPIVNAGRVESKREIDPDPRLVKLRRTLDFDSGKFDYAYHEGELVLYDINKTVGMGSMKFKRNYDQRARALYSLVEERQRR